MSWSRRLFGSKSAKQRPDVNFMSIDEVWAEFCETVAPPGQPQLISTLRSPTYGAALRWLQPPTACPMAKSLLRAFVDLQRHDAWRELDNIAMVYQGESDTDLKPPQESLNALANLCALLRLPASVLYQSGPNDEWAKIELSLQA